MELTITILTSLLGICILLLVMAWILPKQYSVTVSNRIGRNKPIVYEYISILQNQLTYSEWLNADRKLISSVIGEDGTEGATMIWESNNEDKNKSAGAGEMEIKSMTDDTIEVELRLLKPMPGICRLVNHFESIGDGSTIYTCTFHAYAKFPINLPSYLIGRRFIRKAQQRTLDNVRMIIESTPEKDERSKAQDLMNTANGLWVAKDGFRPSIL